MAQRLLKKLEELESDLGKLIHHPMETTLHFLFEAIERRFIFLKNLLSAEMETRPSNPQQLHDIALRMTLLERTFQDWVELTKTPDLDFDAHSVPDSAIDTHFPPDPDIDTYSLCSCSKSYFNEDGERAEPSLPVQLETLPVIAVGERANEGQKKKVLFGKKSCVMAVVVTAFAAWIAATASFSIPGYYEESEFLAPT